MAEQYRNNNFDMWILPVDDMPTPTLYWPTDDEFITIVNVVLGEELYQERIKLHGEQKTALIEEKFTSVECYAWLNEHLQEYAKGYSVPLTAELVLECLLDFEREVVTPWLADHEKTS